MELAKGVLLKSLLVDVRKIIFPDILKKALKKLPEKWLGLMKFKGKLEQIKHDEEQYLAYKTNEYSGP